MRRRNTSKLLDRYFHLRLSRNCNLCHLPDGISGKLPQLARSIDSRGALSIYIVILLCRWYLCNDRRIARGWNFESHNYQLEFPAKGDKGLVELFYTAYADLDVIWARSVTRRVNVYHFTSARSVILCTRAYR